jgi:hypothetical protein
LYAAPLRKAGPNFLRTCSFLEAVPYERDPAAGLAGTSLSGVIYD